MQSLTVHAYLFKNESLDARTPLVNTNREKLFPLTNARTEINEVLYFFDLIYSTMDTILTRNFHSNQKHFHLIVNELLYLGQYIHI